MDDRTTDSAGFDCGGENEERGALTQLRAYMAGSGLQPGNRLPAERQLCAQLGITRAAVRTALATLESEGRIWRHVGRGTFVSNRLEQLEEPLASIAERTSPAAIMEARLAMEPELAKLAALHATADDLAELERCIDGTRSAREWRVYESWDNQLHRAIAMATHNPVLLSLFDTLNTLRRAVVWGRLRAKRTMDSTHHSLTEHERIVAAIRERDIGAASERMREHLTAVRLHLEEVTLVSRD